MVGKCTARSGTVALVKDYRLVPERNCYGGHGATNLDGNVPISNVSVQQCLDYCESDPACSAAQYKVPGSGAHEQSCWRRANVVLSKCSKQSSQNVYLRPTHVSPPTPALGTALLYAAELYEGDAPPLNGY